MEKWEAAKTKSPRVPSRGSEKKRIGSKLGNAEERRGS